jgi:hypothetical protein
VNAVMSSPPPPISWTNRRKAVSLTPDMGASTMAGRISTPPMCTHSGTRALLGGAVGIAGLVQNLRIAHFKAEFQCLPGAWM